MPHVGCFTVPGIRVPTMYPLLRDLAYLFLIQTLHVALARQAASARLLGEFAQCLPGEALLSRHDDYGCDIA